MGRSWCIACTLQDGRLTRESEAEGSFCLVHAISPGPSTRPNIMAPLINIGKQERKREGRKGKEGDGKGREGGILCAKPSYFTESNLPKYLVNQELLSLIFLICGNWA